MAIISIETFLVVDAVDLNKDYELTGNLDGVLGGPMPPGVFVGLYGRAGPAIASELHESYAQEGKQLLLCEVEVEAGSKMQSRVDVNVTPEERESARFLCDLSEVHTVDVRRGRKRLWDTMESLWGKYLREEGVDPEKLFDDVGEDFPRKLTTRPDFAAKLHAEKEFNHLNCLIFPVLTENNYLVSIAAVFRPEAIRRVRVRNDSRIKVSIPDSVWSK